jgi:subtilisin family serine protease
MAKHRTLLLASCLSLLVAGCGGGGGGGVGSTPTPTPTPPRSPTPTPAPTPTPSPTPTPTGTFTLGEYEAGNNFTTSNGSKASNAAYQAKAVNAYNAGATGAGVKIAILDSGLTDANGEFTGRIDSASKDMVSNRGFADGDAKDGHGTSVTAVAAAGANGKGILGVAYNATVLALRTDAVNSCAGSDGCQHFDNVLADAVDYARANGARVINMSLGGSAMSSGLKAAVGRATAAGIIVVVAAGNCGAVTADCSVAETQPDAFAQFASDSSARGLVIIAGSHNVLASGSSTYVKSSFANPAGGYANFYLTALGSNVMTFDNLGDYYLYSGTSYSAPAISGAVALLAQAFPNLTGAQIVDLLMTTATDAGAVGPDAMFGRGILNLTGAFQPQGSSSLAGSSVPVSLDNNATLSPAMGDANTSVSGQAVFLDQYARAYSFNIGSTIRRMAAIKPLTNAIGNDARRSTIDLGGASIAMRVSGTSMLADPNIARWMGEDSRAFSNRPDPKPRTLGGSVSLRLGAKTTGFASFGERIDAAPAPEASFMIANDPTYSPGFDANRDMALGIRHELGRWSLTVSGEQGNARRLKQGEVAPRYTLLSTRADRAFGPLRVGIAAGMMREDSSVLGARFGAALGGGGATTSLADLDLGLALNENWSLRGQWRQAWTRADAGGALTSGRLQSNAFSFDVVRQGNISRFGMRVAQPLRVESGGYRLNLPTGYDYATLTTSYTPTMLSLAARGRELDLEANYGRVLGAGWIDTNLFFRRDPGNIAAMSNDVGAAVRFTLGF